VVGLGDISAAGLPEETGIVVVAAPAGSAAASLGLRPGDVILKFAGKDTKALDELLRVAPETATGTVTIFRDQHEMVLGR